MSPSLKQMKDEMENDLNNGFSDGGYVHKTKSLNTHNTDGSKTNFYDVNGCEDVDDLAEHWKLYGDEFNVLKALVGIAKARQGHERHGGTDSKRDTKKLLHYAQRINKRVCYDGS